MEKKKAFKKNFLIILIIVIAVLAIAVSSWTVAQNLFEKYKKEDKKDVKEKVNITPLMYEITKEGSNNKIYLFGSMHVVDLDEFDFPDYVMDAYNNSDIVAPEFDIIEFNSDYNSAMELAQSLMYTDGTTVKDHMDVELYEKMIDFATKKKIYVNAYEYFNLAFWYSLIEDQAAKDSGISNGGVDTYFLNKAKEDNKEILEVESYQFQTGMLLKFPDRLYELFIKDMVENYDVYVEQTNELYKVWKNGDPEELNKMINNETSDIGLYSEEDKALIIDFNEEFIDNRNIGMKNKLVQWFNEDKKVFFMVGAGHLVGDKGIANLLIQEGYTVKQVNK